MSKFEQYEHHGELVWVRSELKGKHREYNLCFSCKKFVMDDPKTNCHLAEALFDRCFIYDMATPVFECAEFEEKK